MFCKKCGNLLKEGEKFCRKCGNPVTIVPAQKRKTESESLPPKKNKKKKASIIILCIIITILIVAIIIGGWLLFREIAGFSKNKGNDFLKSVYQESQSNTSETGTDKKIKSSEMNTEGNTDWDKKKNQAETEKISTATESIIDRLVTETTKEMDTEGTTTSPAEEQSVQNICFDQNKIAAGYAHSVAIINEGRVVSVGINNADGRLNTEDWEGIVSVKAGTSHTVGLHFDGTAEAVGNNDYGQCEVSSWTDIVSISTGYNHTVGLKNDGTVVATGDNSYAQCEVEKWDDIILIEAGVYHTLGLKSDGTVVAAGNNSYGQCNVGTWEDIVDLAAGYYHSIGLKSDGSLVAIGDNTYGQCRVEHINNVKDLACGEVYTLMLKTDGSTEIIGKTAEYQPSVGEWQNITAISAANNHSMGLTEYGEIVEAGVYLESGMDQGVDITGQRVE